MTRRHSAHETERMAKAKRSLALQRNELRGGDRVEHKSAAGATSAPIKVTDPEVQRMINEYQNRQVAR